MWQEITAALMAFALGTAPFWNGFATAHLLDLLNLAIAAHVIYLSVAGYGLSRWSLAHETEREQRRWMMGIAGLLGGVAVFLPTLVGAGANVAATRDNLIFGAGIFFFSMWAALRSTREMQEAEG